MGALHHAYGSAIDVPDQLRGLRSPERDTRHAALNQLSGNVYHQGTRWQASCHTVRFLVALVDDPATPDRASVLGLLRAVGVGDRRDDHLPFRPDRTFADADAVGDEQLAELIRWLYHGDDPYADDTMTDLGDAAALRWDADSFRAAAEHTDRYARWVGDTDPEVAARAAELLAWFAPTDAAVTALLMVPADPVRAPVRASANLTLAHLDTEAVGIEHRLRELLTTPPPAVHVTAAVALAYRLGDRLPDRALDILIRAGEQDPPPESPRAGTARCAGSSRSPCNVSA